METDQAKSFAYGELLARLRRIHVLGSVAGLLGWDEQVNLPQGAAARRGEQMALLAELAHAEGTAAGLGAVLAACEAGGAELDAEARLVVAGARRDYERATRLPTELVAEKARLSSEAYHAWAAARAARDFGAFAPFLEKHLALARREAELLGYGERPYDLAIDRHDPGLTAAQVDALFTRLRAGLVPLARRIDAAASEALARGEGPVALRGFDVEAQRRLVRAVTARLGFDYERGRLDVSLHPFCEGSGDDVRLTTRFDADQPLDALYSSIHEAGHGLYEQGLPAAYAGTVLGVAAGMAVHESQSRLWENQVARSRAFWRGLEPEFRAAFPGPLAGISGDALHAAANAVEPGGLIRVDADEVHYNLHILLRFELEKRLFAGELAVADLPAAWDDLSEELLGRRPEHAGEGVLQDVHWSGGAFGYFPSYTLGNMIAAQLWTAAQARLPGLEEDFSRGEFGRLLGWLRREVHAHGRREDAFALTRRVTGAELGPEALLAYLEQRYGG
ncbi:MAG: carboxypeptidase M32 [Verrucomicrobia bacterium]|nr:carboxypeptidase M32 [Verrucomicrobiota bacterium]